MKKTLKRMTALAFAATMMVGLSGSAAANGTALGANGEADGAQSEVLILEKELRAYNADEATVNAPTITYNYSVVPANVSEDTQITDAASVTMPVKPGIGTFDAVVSWTSEDELSASADGTENKKNFSIDFSTAVFTGVGVYRYEITESLASGFTYDNTGVTQTTQTTDAPSRFIDVYVKPAESFGDGSSADDWDIYGFTCFCNNESITDSDKTTGAVKTTGFVGGTSGGSEFLADQYYTYNLTISKEVRNDNFAKVTHEFPFSVIFTNENITNNISLKTTIGGTAKDFTHKAGAPTWSGVAKLKSEGSIKYIGIPVGTSVEVYETNDVAGTTYQVETTRDGATTYSATDQMVTSGAAPTAAVAQADPKNAYESTKTVVMPEKDKVDTVEHAIHVINTLLTISPTGVSLRFAPYAMMLLGGAILLAITYRRGSRCYEED